MAEKYSFKDARKTIKKFNNILLELQKVESIVEKYKTDMLAKAEAMLNIDFFQNKLTADLDTGKVTDVDYNETYDLMVAIYSYFESKKLLEYCMGLYVGNNEYIKDNIKSLGKCKNVFSWLFANKTRKEYAKQAYARLKYPENEQFYTDSLNAVTRLNNLVATAKSEVLADVMDNEEEYQKILFVIKPFITDVGKKVSCIERLKDEYGYFVSDLKRMEEDFLRAKDEVKKSIDELMEQEVKDVLKSLPLEELNRDKSGIKIQALKDFGYTSLANVYDCTHRYLVQMPGIGEKGAYQIEAICDRIVKDTRQNMKIKLTTDKKTFYTTQVVYAIYKYKEKKKILDEKFKLDEEVTVKIEEAFKLFHELANGIKYYFSTKEENTDSVIKYSWLKKNIKEEGFCTRAKELLKQYEDAGRKSKFETWIDFAKDTAAYYSVIEELCPNVLGNEDYYYGLPAELAKAIQEEPLYLDGLNCTLRHYQEIGAKYILHQKKVLLGDEMGLGKTVQAIASMVSLRNTGATHFLVVCPASVVVNWCREIKKHSNLEPIKIHGSSIKTGLSKWVENGGVAVTTFETTDNIVLEDGYKYSMLVVDEAHYIKNPEAQRTVNTIRLSNHAERMLFMTGTALENRVDEMIGLIGILNHEVYSQVARIGYLSTAIKFREKVAPVYYRRKREDVLTELPELTEYKDWCTMTPYEEKVYEDTILNGSYPDVRRLSWHIDDLTQSSKATRLLELVEQAKDEDRKIIIFSFFLDTIEKIAKLLEKECVGVITGAIDSAKRQEIIDNLDKAPAGSVIIAQIIAGGTGLNIQSASVVILCEPQLKPSTENQAISRAYRMGQARNVLVHRLLCDETIDERIIDLLEEKQKIFDTFADKSAAAEQTLEIEEAALGNIIKDEAKRIKEKQGK